MNITIEVAKQHLIITSDEIIVAGSQNYLNAVFSFSSEWAGLMKTVIFRNGTIIKAVMLNNDRCEVPPEVIKDGWLCITVFGGDLITTDIAKAYISTTGYSEPIEDPTPDVYTQIMLYLSKFNGGNVGQYLRKIGEGDGDFAWMNGSGGGGDAEWGSIIGNITSQLDLMGLLAGKADEEDVTDIIGRLDADEAAIATKANASDIPTKTSDLTNDSGFITDSYHDSSKQDALVSGINIKTINGNSVLGSGNLVIGGSGSADWGQIGGTLSNQTDLQTALDAKQASLVSGTNIKTVNGNSLLGSGNIEIPGGGTTVVANPTETGSEVVLDRIQIGSGHYKIDYEGITEAVKDYVDNEILGGTA